MSDSANIIGKNIVRLRTVAGLSPSELARKIKVRPQELSGWENGRYKQPSLLKLKLVAWGIGCTLDALTDGLYVPNASISDNAEKKSGTVTPSVIDPDVQITHTASSSSGSPRVQAVSLSSAPDRISVARHLKKHARKLTDHAAALSTLADSLLLSPAAGRPTPAAGRRAGGTGSAGSVYPKPPRGGGR